jgi:prolyl-tRNA editing enzyme YbaK/EbsC (Cys-tRNA(Pro) deacylase)
MNERVDAIKLSQHVGTGNFKLASPDVSELVTGYSHHSVTPFGMKKNIPIIISDSITKMPPDTVIWLGAGQRFLKCQLRVRDLLSSTLDVSSAHIVEL